MINWENIDKRWEDEKYCLREVKINGYNIKYVKNQTEKVCLEAVKQEGLALQFVKTQTPEIVYFALKQKSDLDVNLIKINKEEWEEWRITNGND